MGIGLPGMASLCGRDEPKSKTVYSGKFPNPNKFRFRIKDEFRFPNNWMVVRINYLDCTNYEGNKILVYDSIISFEMLVRGKAIDPHFNEKEFSPVARFEPTKRGLSLAIEFAKSQKGHFKEIKNVSGKR